MSVFAGGCTLEAAEEVCDADLDTLRSLVEKSLLRFTEVRYWMLETIREFAGERLESLEVEQRYVRHFVGLVSRLGVDHSSLTADAAVMKRLDVESPNLRDVLGRLVDRGDSERALDLTADLSPYWLARGRLHEGLTWVEAALAFDGDDVARGRALSAAADFSWMLGDLSRARAYAVENVELAERLGEPRAIAQALHDLAEVVSEERDFELAKNLYEQAIGRAREVGYPAPGAIGNLASIAFVEGDYERSRQLSLDAMRIFCDSGNRLGYAIGLLNLACADLYGGDSDAARLSLRESLGICLEVGYAPLSGACLRACAAILARSQRLREAACILGANERLLDELRSPLYATEQRMQEETLVLIRDAANGIETAEAWESGRALSLEEALSLAIESLGDAQLGAAP